MGYTSLDHFFTATVDHFLLAIYMLQQDLIVSRTQEAFYDKIVALIEAPERLAQLSAENLSRIKLFTRETEAEKWQQFFSKTLASVHNPNKIFLTQLISRL